jgi:iron-sulfur cluster repair protein YtfE (RIC family)
MATEQDLTMLRLIHAALRRDVSRLTAALSDPSADSRAAALHDQWREFSEQLHHHHTGEDEVVWPLLQQRAGDAADKVVAEMAAEHVELGPLLRVVDERFDAYTAAPSAATREPLAAALGDVATAVEHHLSHEEQTAVPLLMSSLSSADVETIGKSQRKKAGLSGARRFLPWALEDGPPADVDTIMGEMPPPFRWLVRRWQRAHDLRVAAAYGD